MAAYSLSDSRPELRDVLVVLQDVTEWQDLGIYLGLPDATIRQIASHHDVMGHKRMMISEWLKYDTEASWTKLAWALTCMRKNVIADDIRRQYVPEATTSMNIRESSTKERAHYDPFRVLAKKEGAVHYRLRQALREISQLRDALEHSSKTQTERIREKERQIQELQRRLEDSNRGVVVEEQRFTSLKQILPSGDSWNIARGEVIMSQDKEIGRGASGLVMEGRYQNQQVAVKQIHKDILHNSVILDEFKREVRRMASIKHPNLVRFIAAVFDDDVERRLKSPLLVLELLQTDLRSAYRNGEIETQYQKISIFRDVAYGLHYLHEHLVPIIHNNLSTANVLLESLDVSTGLWRAKLSDFGSGINFLKHTKSFGVGAIVYTSPEMYPRDDRKSPMPYPTTKYDVFSYGIVLVEVITKIIPTMENRHMLFREVESKWRLMYELASRCTKTDPDDRPSMTDVLNSINRIPIAQPRLSKNLKQKSEQLVPKQRCQKRDVGEFFVPTQPSTFYQEAKSRAKVPFLYHHLLECDSVGREFNIMEHDITVRIPEGAVPEGKKFFLEFGVTIFGPFHFLNDFQPISPVLWLCPLDEDFTLRKPFEIVLPHFLSRLPVNELEKHHITFAKANHSDYCLQDSHMWYKFAPINAEGSMRFASNGGKGCGVLTTNHCCFYCIQAKKTPLLGMQASYCLVRIEPYSSPMNEIHFAATYFLNTCLKALEEQYSVGKLVRHKEFQFKDCENQAYTHLKISVPTDDHHYIVGMEPLNAEIRADEIDFSKIDFNELRLKHDKKMYPPRVMMTVVMKTNAPLAIPINFSGCLNNHKLDVKLTFPLGHHAVSPIASATAVGSEIVRGEQLNLKTVFKKLMPLAHEWKNIGTLLGVPESELTRINSEEQQVNSRLRELVAYWTLKQILPKPTWSELADAVDSFDKRIASDIRKCDVS